MKNKYRLSTKAITVICALLLIILLPIGYSIFGDKLPDWFVVSLIPIGLFIAGFPGFFYIARREMPSTAMVHTIQGKSAVITGYALIILTYVPGFIFIIKILLKIFSKN